MELKNTLKQHLRPRSAEKQHRVRRNAIPSRTCRARRRAVDAPPTLHPVSRLCGDAGTELSARHGSKQSKQSNSKHHSISKREQASALLLFVHTHRQGHCPQPTHAQCTSDATHQASPTHATHRARLSHVRWRRRRPQSPPPTHTNRAFGRAPEAMHTHHRSSKKRVARVLCAEAHLCSRAAVAAAARANRAVMARRARDPTDRPCREASWRGG